MARPWRPYADDVRETAKAVLEDPIVNAKHAHAMLLEYSETLSDLQAARDQVEKLQETIESIRSQWREDAEDYQSRCEVEFRRAERWEAEATRLSMDLQRQDAQLVEMRQAYEACKRDASKCQGCDAYLSVCEEYREQGFTSCCPECKHG